MKRKIILFFLVLISLVFVGCQAEDRTSTTGLFHVNNKGSDDNGYWIDAESEDKRSTRIVVTDKSEWGNLDIGKKYTLHFELKNSHAKYPKSISSYPENYSGRIE